MTQSKKPKKNTTVDNQVKFAFRVPPELYEWLQLEAQSQYRSMNSLMIEALQQFKDRQEATGAQRQGD